ncbi:MAG: DUF192 domain-containing protein [Candidatus Thermoplasmatota archaeon]|nr:DUF192 domain-containing protein [Candidatus Thermoplasmatota archaeon]
MNRYHITLAILVLLVPLCGCLGGGGDNDGEDEHGAYVEFSRMGTKMLTLTCEVAMTQEERARGLMNRTELGSLEGMLFYYEIPREVSFWMKNTLISLDIVYISSDFLVIGVHEADPEPGVPDNELKRYPSGGLVRYVVEMNQGLAAAHDIVPGTEVMVLEF